MPPAWVSLRRTPFRTWRGEYSPIRRDEACNRQDGRARISLSTADRPGLGELRTRDGADPAVAQIDAWAVAANVLTLLSGELQQRGIPAHGDRAGVPIAPEEKCGMRGSRGCS